ncbi:3-deoxy-7-phosphoheptulonate synthase [Xenorhabdus bovienii]|uniref:3-deoxy-7-phosphoheptulonate synthase n=1 Tax=Xenorhabdus bovienii TaxID=40576 RepID=UPI0023B31EEC|nr:3-deoxy-7-phosphoheptulonate synthase [Xenorhabdus bovienii]MDE9541043.1 3-deoxy-7-phosphoheptulonate synthase [Xenorhabdus bovienii]
MRKEIEKLTWQQPLWENKETLSPIKNELSGFSGLIKYDEINRLYLQLEKVWSCNAIIFQAGDCAERIKECNYNHVLPKIKFLHEVSNIFSKIMGKPVITVGRIAGQYAKPRSQEFEICGDVYLPVWRGDCINGFEPTKEARRHDPEKMLSSYSAAEKTLSFIKDYNKAEKDKSDFLLWTSHEALLLDYELTQLRIGVNSEQYLSSTHWPWIGVRTLDLDGPHVNLLSKIINPVACKIDDTVTPSIISRLCKKLNPNKIPGRLTLIVRFGSKKINKFGQLIDAVMDTGIPVLWMCDPMHGNTKKSNLGYKHRYIIEMVDEIVGFQKQLIERGAYCAGIHLETTSEGIPECFGAGYIPQEKELKKIVCDPRLNKSQTLYILNEWNNICEGFQSVDDI